MQCKGSNGIEFLPIKPLELLLVNGDVSSLNYIIKALIK